MGLQWLRLLLMLGLLPGTLRLAVASEYYGQVTFNNLPAPGVTVRATRGSKTVAVTTDERGIYRFDDLADGAWKLDISLQCFQAIHADVDVSPSTAPGKFTLQLLPMDALKAMATTQTQPQLQAVAAPPAGAAQKKADAQTAPNAPAEIPKPPDEANQQSNDGFLVNGSVNNAATSAYSLSQAFGNRRSNSRSLYNGGVAVVLGNSALDARPYSISGFSTPKPGYNRITIGLTFGGPIKIPHVLPRGPNFFAAYQFTRNGAAQTSSGLVPTAEERAGNLLNGIGQPTTIIDPVTGEPYPGNVVPVSDQARALLALYPLPDIANNPLYNYQTTVLNSTHQDVAQMRLDKTLGRRDQLYGTFNLQSSRAGSLNLFHFADATDTLGINASANWSHRFNPHLFGFFGYNFSRQRILVRPNFDGKENISGNAGITGNEQSPENWGPPALNFTMGTAALSDAQSSFNRARTDRFTASGAYYRGRHNVSFGGDLRKQQYNDYFQQDPRGTFSFTGAATNSDLADFLIGTPDTSSIAFGNADKYFRESVYDAYATDDWRVLPILTINAGVRWEYGAPMTELFGRIVNLDVAPGFTAVKPVLGSAPIGPETGEHYPASLIRPDRRGVEPRVALSWRPIPASTVVVRAGYGIYHDTSVYLTPVLQLAQQAPLSNSVKQQNSPDCTLTLADGFTNCGTTTAESFAIDPNFRVGYAQTWQVAVQRDLPYAMQGTVTYLGVKGTHGVQQYLPNSYPIGESDPCALCPSGFVYESTGGNSTRQSGMVQLRRRLRAGFLASLQYTYSKSIDDDSRLGGQGYTSSSQSGESGSAAVAQNWQDLRAERSLSSFDQRHLFNVQAQYTSGQGLEGGSLLGGWRGRALKEWTLLTQITAGSGLPETPVYPTAMPGTGFVGVIRPSLTGAPIYGATGPAHINAAAYTSPSPGAWGTAGRNSITGPSQFSLDGSLQRTFRPRGNLFLDVRADATNLLNHPVDASWNTTVGNTQFGLPLSVNAMRSMQLTFRLRY